MAWWHRPSQWLVTLRCRGRHPYLKSHDLDCFEGTRDVVITVTAKSWADAEKKALHIGPAIRAWAYSVEAISRSALGGERS